MYDFGLGYVKNVCVRLFILFIIIIIIIQGANIGEKVNNRLQVG